MSVTPSSSAGRAPFHYRAFGLNVSSELEMRNWPPGQSPCDIAVTWGDVPTALENASVLWDGRFWGRKGIGLLSYPHVGRMLIEDGDRVTLSLGEEGNPEKLAHVLASTGFTALLYQRGRLCLHASAVAFRGRGYLIMGPSGAGKSTLASALAQRGCEFVSDDITVITPREDGTFEAAPSFPAIRLRRDSHEALALGEHASGAFDPLDEKFRLRYGGAAAEKPIPIARVCFLENDEMLSAPRATPILGQERVSALQRSFFRRAMARIVGDPQRLATLSIELARRVEVVRVTRPKSGFALDELCACVLG